MDGSSGLAALSAGWRIPGLAGRQLAGAAAGDNRTSETDAPVVRLLTYGVENMTQSSPFFTLEELLFGSAGDTRVQLSAAQKIPEFLAKIVPLSKEDMAQIVVQATCVLRDVYVHLPAKLFLYAAHPLRKLALLSEDIEARHAETAAYTLQFHQEMLGIFFELRDMHTGYYLPTPFGRAVAFLPFEIERLQEGGADRFVITHILNGFMHEHFQPGVEIKYWNGVPIGQALAERAYKSPVGDVTLRYVYATTSMTVRSLARELPPLEEWVQVGFQDANGTVRVISFEWRIIEVEASEAATPELPRPNMAIDYPSHLQRRVMKMMFSRPLESEKDGVESRRLTSRTQRSERFPAALEYRAVTHDGRRYGYIRIRTFDVDDADAFVEEFASIVDLIPSNGLIIDVRDNLGGIIHAAEGILQLLCARTIEPIKGQLLQSAVLQRVCHLQSPPLVPAVGMDFSPWVKSVKEATQTGASHSAAFPITPPAFANNMGQRYYGPSLLIMNCRTFSAAEVLAAGFQDHQIGVVLGTDKRTGGGGAIVWTHGYLRFLFADATKLFIAPLPDSPFSALPSGVNLSVSAIRLIRSGDYAGLTFEDFGVVADFVHTMTMADLLHSNEDLLKRACAILSTQKSARIKAEPLPTGGETLRAKLVTVNINRVDVFVGERACGTYDVVDGETLIEFKPPSRGGDVKLRCYRENELVAVAHLAASASG